MRDGFIAIVGGGATGEREASRTSARHVNELLSRTHATALLDLSPDGWKLISAPGALELAATPPLLVDPVDGSIHAPRLVFLATHGRPGETGELQGYLDLLSIPYTGSGVLASALAQDKYRCKAYLAGELGLRIPGQLRCPSHELGPARLAEAGITVPFVVKPNDEGSGIGVISVHSQDAVTEALARCATISPEFIVEEFIDGREITVGALRTADSCEVIAMSEVIREFPAVGPVRSYGSRQGSTLVTPAQLDARITVRLRDVACSVGDALDLRGCFRMDCIVAGQDIFFLEVNTIPGLGPSSVLVRQAAASGISPQALVSRVMRDGMAKR